MNKEKVTRYFMSCAMIIAMCFISVLAKEKEIIFPEVAALTIGAWLVPKNPWKINHIKMILLMALSTVCGITIVCLIPFIMPIKLILGFLVTAIIVVLSKTNMVPVISACILPIMMGTDTIIYPISVTIMTAIIVVGQILLEKLGYNNKIENATVDNDLSTSVHLWIKRLVLYMAILILPIISGEYLFIAPPLIVAFVELTGSKSLTKHKSFKISLVIITSAFVGTAGRLLCEYTAIPLYICALMAIVPVFILFEIMEVFFPPAGAIALLSLIILPTKILIYPLAVSIGCILFICMALLFFQDKDELQTYLAITKTPKT